MSSACVKLCMENLLEKFIILDTGDELRGAILKIMSSYRDRHRETEKQRDRNQNMETERQTDRETDRQRDRQTDRERGTKREREIKW